MNIHDINWINASLPLVNSFFYLISICYWCKGKSTWPKLQIHCNVTIKINQQVFHACIIMFNLLQWKIPVSPPPTILLQHITLLSLGAYHLISRGGMEVLEEKKRKKNSPSVGAKKTSLIWVTKKKKKKKVKKKIQLDPEIQWRDGNFWKKKKKKN